MDNLISMEGLLFKIFLRANLVIRQSENTHCISLLSWGSRNSWQSRITLATKDDQDVMDEIYQADPL